MCEALRAPLAQRHNLGAPPDAAPGPGLGPGRGGASPPALGIRWGLGALPEGCVTGLASWKQTASDAFTARV